MILEVQDRIEIEELFSISNFRIDRFDAEGWADLFTEDGELIVDGIIKAKGRNALIDVVLAHQQAGRRLSHWTANLWTERNSEGTRAHVYLMAFEISKTLDAPFVIGEYDDDLIKQEGIWKFRKKRMNTHIRREILT